jgi:replicative DNA helicase
MTRSNSNAEILDLAPPRDHETECAVLACVLVHPGRFAEVAAALKPEHFDAEANRTIFDAMLRLHSAGKPIDATLLVGLLRDIGKYDPDRGVCVETLCRHFRLFALVSNLPYYTARLIEIHRRRHARQRGERLIQAAHSVDGGPGLPPASIRRANAAAVAHRRASKGSK